MAGSAGIPFDRGRAVRDLRQAELDIPPTAPRASRRRLEQAAATQGLQVLTRQLSINEALATVQPNAPLALFAVGADGTGRWHLLLDAQGVLSSVAHVQDHEGERYIDGDELARSIDVASPEIAVEWLIAQPAAPMASRATPADETRGADHDEHGLSPIARLLGLVWQERGDLLIVIAYAIGVGVLSLATPIAAMAVVNTAALATLVQQLFVLCLALFISLGLAACLNTLQIVVVEYMQRRIFVNVVAELAYRLPRIDIQAFDRQHGPELVNRFFDVLTVQKTSATLLLDGISVTLQTIIGLTLLATYHQLLLGFDIVLIAGLAFVIFVLGWGAVETSIRESKAKYAVASWMEEMARHPAAFKLCGGPRFALERADALARDYLVARGEHFHILCRQVVFVLTMQALAITSLLGLGGYLVIQGQLTLGQLVAAEIVVALVVASFAKLGKQFENYYDLLAAIEKLGHLVDLPLERTTGIVHQPRSRGAAVVVQSVSFVWTDSGRTILENFNLALEPGERVALLGPNGSGKSTLVDLLFGLRTPTSGRIEIDGTDLRDLRLESLRDHVAIVKGIEVFEEDVLENVRMGRDELSLANIQEALQKVGLLEDIREFPQGLRLRLGTGGSPLSSGQAKRLMLARAIVGQPRLLVLDETFDDMDEEFRREMLPALVAPAMPWTLLVVTHSPDVARSFARHVRLERCREVKAPAEPIS